MVRSVPRDGADLRSRGEELEPRARFAKVNVDEEPAIAARFGIRGIPTLIAFEHGKVAKQHAGLVDIDFCAGSRGNRDRRSAQSRHRIDCGLSIEAIFSGIERAALVPRGALRLEEDERIGALAEVRTIVLIGMAGRNGWGAFAAGDEVGWIRPSARSLEPEDHRKLANDFGAISLFPFGGPPYLPFQRWAQRAEPLHVSPIGLLIHPRYGLWHSYRGGLGFREALDCPEPEPTPGPCDSCRERWCLHACPVGAFSIESYDVRACVSHLKSAAAGECMEGGCLARRACPVGAEHAHGPEQAGFTMRAFSAQGKRG